MPSAAPRLCGSFPPQITFVPVDPEAEQFLDHKPIALPERDTR